jgi:hypothetical protein
MASRSRDPQLAPTTSFNPDEELRSRVQRLSPDHRVQADGEKEAAASIDAAVAFSAFPFGRQTPVPRTSSLPN